MGFRRISVPKVSDPGPINMLFSVLHASYNESYDAMMVASTSVCILYPAVRNSTGAG
jgi:hypothetical protein